MTPKTSMVLIFHVNSLGSLWLTPLAHLIWFFFDTSAQVFVSTVSYCVLHAGFRSVKNQPFRNARRKGNSVKKKSSRENHSKNNCECIAILQFLIEQILRKRNKKVRIWSKSNNGWQLSLLWEGPNKVSHQTALYKNAAKEKSKTNWKASANFFEETENYDEPKQYNAFHEIVISWKFNASLLHFLPRRRSVCNSLFENLYKRDLLATFLAQNDQLNVEVYWM